MEMDRINHEYLSQLFQIAMEQNEKELVSQLYRSLLVEHGKFIEAPFDASDPDRRREIQQRAHKLKNNFFNLGCEQAGHALENLYQALKTEDGAKSAPRLMDEFRLEAEATLRLLGQEMNRMSH